MVGQQDKRWQGINSEAKAKAVRALLEKGADVNTKDKSCSTPLHLASSEGSYETMRILIEHGADVAAKDTSDRTPLHMALSWVCSFYYCVTLNLAQADVKDSSIAWGVSMRRVT